MTLKAKMPKYIIKFINYFRVMCGKTPFSKSFLKLLSKIVSVNHQLGTLYTTKPGHFLTTSQTNKRLLSKSVSKSPITLNKTKNWQLFNPITDEQTSLVHSLLKILHISQFVMTLHQVLIHFGHRSISYVTFL